MRKRALLVGALAFACVPFVGVSPAHACGCIGVGDQGNFERSEVVFQGTVLEPPGATSVRLMASRVYKGAVPAAILIETGSPNLSCHWEPRGPGPFLVFASAGRSGTLETDPCSGTRPIDASETLSFGDGVPVALSGGPTTARRPGLWSTALPIAAVAGSAGLLAVALLRRRRPAG